MARVQARFRERVDHRVLVLAPLVPLAAVVFDDPVDPPLRLRVRPHVAHRLRAPWGRELEDREQAERLGVVQGLRHAGRKRGMEGRGMRSARDQGVCMPGGTHVERPRHHAAALDAAYDDEVAALLRLEIAFLSSPETQMSAASVAPGGSGQTHRMEEGHDLTRRRGLDDWATRGRE